MNGHEIRQAFTDFFEQQSHTAIKSAPLIPHGDNTLLFVNAGMVPFKDVFTGIDKRPYTRATSVQKCVRAGGKHNDLENVGRTARHHTFFEMLGNFSFGDYFKEDACRYAWHFLTKVLNIPADRLSVTIFGGEGDLPADVDAERIWRDIVGVSPDKISRCGAKDNFWSMGDTGPCGPCTEIHYERESNIKSFGGDDPEGDRVLEVWNLVFMQYDRQKDGALKPLPSPCVDTGMGLERITMVLNQAPSNYDTDLFAPLLAKITALTGKNYAGTDSPDDVSTRVVADHARATAFLMADGVMPSNEGRGYVLRRIMRRAIRHGARLGLDENFFSQVVQTVINTYGEAYPELVEAGPIMCRQTDTEETLFRKTLRTGIELFEKVTEKLQPGAQLDGQTVFQLKATFGFPTDLTNTLCEENGFTIDWDGLWKAEAAHAKVSSGGLSGEDNVLDFKQLSAGLDKTTYVDMLSLKAQVIALFDIDGETIDTISPGESGWIVFDKTPFYAEGGGQVGDTGTLSFQDESLGYVVDTQKGNDVYFHLLGKSPSALALHDVIQLQIDGTRRLDIMRNHSATHLMHHALREHLGEHVTQKGSIVLPDRLRFDYAHPTALSDKDIAEVEQIVNDKIRANVLSSAEVMPLEQAKERGAMALFGEKYGDDVRVVKLGESVEFCGGSHVSATGEIGIFKIISETALAAGIRRIEAVTGRDAMTWFRTYGEIAKTIAAENRVGLSEAVDSVRGLKDENKRLLKEVERLEQKLRAIDAKNASNDVKDVNGIKLLAVRADGIGKKGLRDYADKLRDQLGSGVVVIGHADPEKESCTLLVAVTKDLKDKVHAGRMVGELAAVIDGRGGGKPDFAQAGGKNPGQLDQALQKAEASLKSQL